MEYVFKFKEKTRNKVNKLAKSDESYEDSLYTLAKKEDEIRKEMIKDNLDKKIVEKYADMFSTIEMEKMKLEKESLTDKLTGIKNRRALEKIAPEIMKIERRNNRKLSVLMLDIDFFKTYNDTFGHPAGDEIIKALPKIIGRVIRSSDQIFRYGGEEFVILLPETDAVGAKMTAEKIRKEVAAALFMPITSEEKQKVTVSIGIFSSEQLPVSDWQNYKEKKSDEILKMMLEKADKALYKAKEQGRNSAAIFDDSMEVINNK